VIPWSTPSMTDLAKLTQSLFHNFPSTCKIQNQETNCANHWVQLTIITWSHGQMSFCFFISCRA
jgi:hypothetical protein